MNPDDGWLPWIMPLAQQSPYRQDFVEIMREGWSQPRTVNPRSLPPEMNAADLFWRPTSAIITLPVIRVEKY